MPDKPQMQIRTVTIRAAIVQAAELYHAGRYEDCRQLCLQLLEQRPEQADGQEKFSAKLAKRGRYPPYLVSRRNPYLRGILECPLFPFRLFELAKPIGNATHRLLHIDAPGIPNVIMKLGNEMPEYRELKVEFDHKLVDAKNAELANSRIKDQLFIRIAANGETQFFGGPGFMR